jgi:AsmA family protein
MNRARPLRAGLLIGAAFAILLLAGWLAAAALDAGMLRRPLIGFFSSYAGRTIQIDGPLRVKLLSRNPVLTAERVTIGNPPWTPAGATAEIDKITLEFTWSPFAHSRGIDALKLESPTFHLLRDAEGRANWQFRDPANGPGSGPPLIKALYVEKAGVTLDDARRHIKFDGWASAQTASDVQAPLHIEGGGKLNGRPCTFDITGAPLRSARHDGPYGFEFVGRSNRTQIKGRGELSRAFNFQALDTSFEASGPNLRDLYFLTGVSLINTGSYHLKGRVALRGLITVFSDLGIMSGESDMHGGITINAKGGRAMINGELWSNSLRSVDIGVQAAARDSGSPALPPSGLLLSDATFNPTVMRLADADISFQAQRAQVAAVGITNVSATLRLRNGVIIVSPLTGKLLDGKLDARIKIDAGHDVPEADVAMKLADVQVSQWPRKSTGPPPLEGTLQVGVRVIGRGASIHQVAASADGELAAVLPAGVMRATLAELAGIDLKGLGLLLAKSDRETPIRCGIASFHARQGTLTAQNIVLDTEPVLITGDGSVHMDSESLDLTFHGHPKSTRLFRLRAPLLLQGTLAHPSVAVGGPASLVIVDAGKTQDVDCAALVHGADAVLDLGGLDRRIAH